MQQLGIPKHILTDDTEFYHIQDLNGCTCLSFSNIDLKEMYKLTAIKNTLVLDV
jgi:hypothetical protein